MDGKRTGRGIFLADAIGDIDHAVDGEAFVGDDLKRLDRDAPEVGLVQKRDQGAEQRQNEADYNEASAPDDLAVHSCFHGLTPYKS